MLLLEVEVKAGRKDESRSAAVELAHEAGLVGLLVGSQLARPVEEPPAPSVGAPVLPAVEPAPVPGDLSVRSFMGVLGTDCNTVWIEYFSGNTKHYLVKIDVTPIVEKTLASKKRG